MKRRTLLSVVGASAISLSGCLSVGWPSAPDRAETGLAPDEWPTHQAVPARTGYAPGRTGPTSGGETRWKHELYEVRTTSPAVSGGTVYAASSQHHLPEGVPGMEPPSIDGGLYALSADDGRTLWSYEPGESFYDYTPTVVDDRVYQPTSRGIVSLNASDGSLDWRVDMAISRHCAPLVVDGTVYVGSSAGVVRALSTSDGTLEWERQLWGSLSSPTETSTAPTETSTAPTETAEETVVPDTGSQWIVGSVAAAGDTLFVAGNRGYESGLFALDPATGDERWRVPFDRRMEHGPTVGPERVYVTLGNTSDDDASYVAAVSRRDREEVWRTAVGYNVVGGPGLRNDSLFVGADTGPASGSPGQFRALSVDDGSIEWTLSTMGSITTYPTIAGETVYVGDMAGTLYALTPNGEERWSSNYPDTIKGAPAVVDGTVFFATIGGTFFAVSEPDG